MKKCMLSFLAIFLVLSTLAGGCSREFTYGAIERDANQTGGNLSFVYDEITHTATFGGEGEVIAFYPADPSIGRVKGNRIGFKVFAPCDVKDFSKAKMKFEGSEYTAGSFMQTVYEQNLNYFVLTPLVSASAKEFDLSVTWTQNAKDMKYIIKIANGTLFANES